MADTHDADLPALATSLVDDSTRTLFRDLLAQGLQELIEAELTGRIGPAKADLRAPCEATWR